MNIYICDDEEKILQDISKLVCECCAGSNIRTFSGATDLLRELNAENADILLLDIDMPDINGMEVARM